MRLIDRYLFRQLRAATILAAAALTGIALLSQSLSALDLLMKERQSPWVVLKVTLLATPQLMALVLPIAGLIAALATLARLKSDREFVICASAGMSGWAILSPLARLASWIALLILVLTLWIQPFCYRILRHTLDQARADLAAALVRPGQFTHPAPGLTVYAQSLGDDDTLHNLFIDQRGGGGHGRDNTLTARDGQIRRREGVPVLVLHDGSNQSFNAAGALNFLSFDEYTLDIRQLLKIDSVNQYKLSDLYPHELFFPDLRRRWQADHRRQMLAEGHARLSAPLYALAFAALAAATILGGSGARRVDTGALALAAAVALVERVAGFAAQSAALASPALNGLQYLIPLAATAAALLFLARRPARAGEDRLPARAALAAPP